MITKYNNFINESLRDKMTPKSPDIIIKKILSDKDLVNEIDDYVDIIKDNIKDYLKSHNLNVEDYKIMDFRYDTDYDEIYNLMMSLVNNDLNAEESVSPMDEDSENAFEYRYYKKDNIIYVRDYSGEIEYLLFNPDELKDKLSTI